MVDLCLRLKQESRFEEIKTRKSGDEQIISISAEVSWVFVFSLRGECFSSEKDLISHPEGFDRLSSTKSKPNQFLIALSSAQMLNSHLVIQKITVKPKQLYGNQAKAGPFPLHL